MRRMSAAAGLLFRNFNSPIATRFGVYFLHGWCSCLRPFSENVRFGVPVFFPLGVPVVSRLCPGGVPVVRWCPGGVPVVSRGVPVVSLWCPGGVPVVSRWCNGIPVVPRCVPVVSRWCPSDVPVVFRVSVVSRCHIAGPVVSGVRVLSQWYPGRFPVVCRWCCRMSSGVSVVSRWLVSQSQWCRVLLCVSVVSQCCSPIATRFGVYFLHGLCSCLCPFSENVRFGVPVFFPLGVPVVSRLCPGGVPVVSLWCRGGVPVVSRRCNGLVSVVSRRCPNGVPVVFRVSVVSRCHMSHIAGPVVSRSCAGGVPVVSRSCPVVSRWCCSVSSGVPVMSRWLVPQSCPGGVAAASRGVPVVCPSGRVPCFLGPGGVPPSGVPAMSGVPRGGAPAPTTIGVAVGWRRSVIRSVF